jgi:hypothetical protein
MSEKFERCEMFKSAALLCYEQNGLYKCISKLVKYYNLFGSSSHIVKFLQSHLRGSQIFCIFVLGVEIVTIFEQIESGNHFRT